jgi:hypothetical protein
MAIDRGYDDALDLRLAPAVLAFAQVTSSKGRLDVGSIGGPSLPGRRQGGTLSAERVGRRLAPILAADVPGIAADGAETLPDPCLIIVLA